jgi:hypothetical protein
MRRKIAFGLVALVAASVLGAESDPSEVVKSAAAKLAQESSYSWKAATELGNFSSATEGKSLKSGLIAITATMGETKTEALLLGNRGAVKTGDEDWQSLAELARAAGTTPGPRVFMVRRLQTFEAPANEAADLVGKAKGIKKDGEVYGGELTEAGAKDLLTFGGRRVGNAAEPKNAKGSVKFWIKDGLLSKYELKLQGTINFNKKQSDIDRTTTVEIKDVGTTKVDVPDPAKEKLAAPGPAK